MPRANNTQQPGNQATVRRILHVSYCTVIVTRKAHNFLHFGIAASTKDSKVLWKFAHVSAFILNSMFDLALIPLKEEPHCT